MKTLKSPILNNALPHDDHRRPCDHVPCDHDDHHRPCDHVPCGHVPCDRAPCDRAPCDHVTCDRAPCDHGRRVHDRWCTSRVRDSARADHRRQVFPPRP